MRIDDPRWPPGANPGFGAGRRQPAGVVARRAFRHRTAQNDIINFGRVDLRSGDRVTDGVTSQRHAMGGIESATIRLADRCTRRGQDGNLDRHAFASNVVASESRLPSAAHLSSSGDGFHQGPRLWRNRLTSSARRRRPRSSA